MKRILGTIVPALMLTALVVAIGAFSAGAQERGGGNDAKVLGGGDSELKPYCEKSRERGTCQAVASLTTFIKQLGEKKNPFVAPADGRIVAWSIELGNKPSNRPPEGMPDAMSNLEIFQDLFGNERYGNGPVARLAILRRQGGGVQFKLTDQSPAVKLSGPFYKNDTVITLERPLPVKEGEIIGLSSLTWIPMLRPKSEGSGKASWRASLNRDDCNSDGILNGKPQKRVGSVREYGCEFDDRLFYKAYFVPNN